MELNKVQNRINNTKSYLDKFSLAKAYWFLTKLFTGDIKPQNNVQSLKVKENVIYALNVIMQEKLGLESGRVKTKLRKLPENIAAEVRELLGDNIFWLQINSRYIESIEIEDLIFSILHEYGHINQTLLAQSGVSVPLAISIGPGYDELTPREQYGMDLLYRMNENEADANRFAYKMFSELLNSVYKNFRDTPEYRKYKKFIMEEYRSRRTIQIKSKIKYAFWRIFNRDADLYDAYFMEKIEKTLPERIYEQNIIYKKDLDAELKRLNKKLDQITQQEYISAFCCMDPETKLDECIIIVDAMIANFAKKHNIPIENLGRACVYHEKGEPVIFMPCDKEICPMPGYFMIDRKEIYCLKSPQKLIKSMQKALKRAQETIYEQQI